MPSTRRPLQDLAERQQKQQELMRKKIAEAQKKLEKMEAGEEEEQEEEEVADLEAYKSPADYPRDVQPNQLRVDFDKECLIGPVNGQPVPFHGGIHLCLCLSEDA